jgi:ribosomal protein S18 acetylase RimI-like enzyme
MHIREPRPEDHGRVIAALGEWMPGSRAEELLPRLYLTHFASTSLVAEADDGSLAGFVVAFESQATAGVGYIHFVWVSPEYRGSGVGRALYTGVFDLLRERGCHLVEAVTRRANLGSIAFHERLGFSADAGGTDADLASSPDVVVLTRRL